MSDVHIAVCWSCGWSKTARSHEVATKKRGDHGHGDWATDILTQDDMDVVNRVRDGAVVVNPEEIAGALESLETADEAITTACETLGSTQ